MNALLYSPRIGWFVIIPLLLLLPNSGIRRRFVVQLIWFVLMKIRNNSPTGRRRSTFETGGRPWCWSRREIGGSRRLGQQWTTTSRETFVVAPAVRQCFWLDIWRHTATWQLIVGAFLLALMVSRFHIPTMIPIVTTAAWSRRAEKWAIFNVLLGRGANYLTWFEIAYRLWYFDSCCWWWEEVLALGCSLYLWVELFLSLKIWQNGSSISGFYWNKRQFWVNID